jgi:uncharacterized lipoprotein
MKKYFIILYLLLCTACAEKQSQRYTDNSALEKPPQLTINPLLDTSSLPVKPIHHGLGRIIEEYDDKTLLIKQPLRIAWRTMEQALRQSDIKIIDRELDKKRYYVIYRDASFLDSFKGTTSDTLNYMIELREKELDTLVSVELANDNEQGMNSPKQRNDSEALLKLLYQTLRHDLTAE